MKRTVIGIAAHVDAGKTTLAESILFGAGAIRSQGRVDRKNSALDTHGLEKERGITIFAGEATFDFKDRRITLLDTPGHVDFSAETERVFLIMDYAVLVVSASDGVQSHTRTVWRLLESYGIPTFVFVTKCDLNRRSKAEVCAELASEFGAVVDFEKRDGIYTNAEEIAACSEKLLDEYVENGQFSEISLASAIYERRLFPCFFGSGLKNEGVADFLESICSLLIDVPYPDDFGARVYKISYEKGNRLTKLRVTGGRLSVRDSVAYNGISEKVNEIRIYKGSKYVTAESVEAGEVCTVCGLSQSAVGQGLGFEKSNVVPVLEPVMSYNLIFPETVDLHAMNAKLKMLEEEDPVLRIKWNEKYSCFTCELMGTVQTEILKSVISDRFGTDVKICKGKVIYKETVKNTVEGVGHYEPLRHYAEVHLLIEPLERSSGIVIDTSCSENLLDGNYQRLIASHLAEREHPGVLTGSALTDVKITLVSGKSHIKHTEGGDFRQATFRAVRQGLMQAENVLLEPYYNYRLKVPAKDVGRALNDIKLMGGLGESVESDGAVCVVCGKAPVVTIGTYASEVAAYTGGVGKLSLEYGGYDVCHNSEEVIGRFGYNPERDVENPVDSVFCAHGGGFTVKWNEVPKYMHLESFFAKKNREVKYGSLSIDEKELEEIMLREFGPIKRRTYAEPVKIDAEDAFSNVAKIKTSCIIVDGYNYIFYSEELSQRAKYDLEGAREELCRILSNYSHFTDIRVILVFDAYNVSRHSGEKIEVGGIDVVYTKENETGDAYIEKLLTDIGKNEKVRVVTSDSLIQLSAVKNGILRMSSAEFEAELDRTDKEIAQIIERSKGGA